MRCIAAKAWVIIEQAGRNEVEFLCLIGVRRRAAARPAKTGCPAIPSRNRIGLDLTLATHPVEALRRRVKYSVSVRAGDLATLRAMALADRADLAVNLELDAPAEATSVKVFY